MNIGDLFDSPLKILIIAVVFLVVFGSTKLPVFARSLGRSARILKSEMTKIHDDDDEAPEGVAQAKAQPQAQALTSPQQLQIEQLQQQVRDLQAQQTAAVNGATAADAAPTNQPG
jgi:sec-independent protein translocase protein TatA